MARFEEDRIPGEPEIPVRVYIPETREPHHTMAVIVYFHGGGWISGDCAYVDAPIRALANRTGVSLSP